MGFNTIRKDRARTHGSSYFKIPTNRKMKGPELH